MSGPVKAVPDVVQGRLLGAADELRAEVGLIEKVLPSIGADAVKAQYALEQVAAKALERIAMEAKVQAYEPHVNWTGCGTGDCPHSMPGDCIEALSKELAGEYTRSEALQDELNQANPEAEIETFEDQIGALRMLAADSMRLARLQAILEAHECWVSHGGKLGGFHLIVDEDPQLRYEGDTLGELIDGVPDDEVPT